MMNNMTSVFLLIFVSISALGMEQGFGRPMQYADLRKTKSEQSCHYAAKQKRSKLKRSASASTFHGYYMEPAPSSVDKPDTMIALSRRQWQQYKNGVSQPVTNHIASNVDASIAEATNIAGLHSPQNRHNIETLCIARLGGMNAGYAFFPFFSALFQ